MNKLIVFFIISITLIQCSPKTTGAIADKTTQVQTPVSNDFRKMAPKPGPAPVINLGEAATFVLDNGLEVIVVENSKIPQVSFQISLKNDPVLEGDKVGVVNMAGELLGRGTTTRSKAEIDQAIDFIGASFNSFSTGMFGSSLTKHSDKLLEIMIDVLFNPAFNNSELDKIKKQTLSGLESAKSDPNSMIGNVRSTVVYGKGHPYGEVQKPEHVDRITIEDTKAYYQNFFIPNNAFLIIVGDITTEKARGIAQKYFGKWERKAFKPQKHRDVVAPSKTQVHFAHKDAAVQSVISVTYPFELKPGHPDVISTSVLNSILGGSFSSRLMQNLREDKAYTYGARSSLSTDPLVANFNATASVRNEVTDSSVDQFMYEIERIKNAPVTENELQAMKSYMTGQFARSLESPQTIARFALTIAKYKLPADYYQSYLKRLNDVSIADLQMVADKYMKPEAAHIIVVGNKDEVADKLKRFDSDGKLDFYDAFGETVTYDQVAIPDNVTPASIIEDYLNAIGGVSTLNTVQSLYFKMTGEIRGQNLILETYNAAPNKYAMSIGNGSMVFQEQVYDGAKALVSQMGQKQVLTEGDALEELKSNAMMFPQMSYVQDAYQMTLGGIEDVDGEKAYKLNLMNANGKKSIEYYSLATGLLIKSIQIQESPQGPMNIITSFSDYRLTNGLLLPYSMKMEGAMPMPLQLKAENIEVNGTIPANKFAIE